jgi:hypothetical protein
MDPVANGTGPVGFVATVAACAVSTGLTAVTGTVLLVDALRGGAYPENLSLRLYLLFGGTVAGVLLSAWAAWRLLEPISSAYRRGGLAMVFGFATVLLMLVCIPVHQIFGRAGLGALLALSGVTAALLSRRAKRLGVGA